MNGEREREREREGEGGRGRGREREREGERETDTELMYSRFNPYCDTQASEEKGNVIVKYCFLTCNLGIIL